MVTLTDQIKSAERELAIRKRVYPKWVDSRKMTSDQCRHEIDCQEATVALLKTWQEKQQPKLI